MRLPSRLSLLGSLVLVVSLIGCAPVDPGEPAPSAAAPAPSPSPGPAPAGPSAPAPSDPSPPDSGWKNLVRGPARLGPVDFSDLGAAGAGSPDQGAAGQDQGPPEEEHPAGSAGAGSTGTHGGEEHGEQPGGAGGSTPENGDHGDAGQAGQAPEEQPAEPECEEGQIQGCFSAGYLAVCQAGGYWGGQACPAEAPLCFQGICWASLPSDPAEPTP